MRYFDIVKKRIDEADYKSLLAAGAPDDEYDLESEMISSAISADSRADEIAEIISEIFSKMFSEKSRPEDFADTAAKIRNDINRTY